MWHRNHVIVGSSRQLHTQGLLLIHCFLPCKMHPTILWQHYYYASTPSNPNILHNSHENFLPCDLKVLPRDAKIGATVEHVKQLRDDITTTTVQNIQDSLKDALQPTEDRMTSLEDKLSKVMRLLESAQRKRETEWAQTAVPVGNAPTVAKPEPRDARAESYVLGE